MEALLFDSNWRRALQRAIASEIGVKITLATASREGFDREVAGVADLVFRGGKRVAEDAIDAVAFQITNSAVPCRCKTLALEVLFHLCAVDEAHSLHFCRSGPLYELLGAVVQVPHLEEVDIVETTANEAFQLSPANSCRKALRKIFPDNERDAKEKLEPFVRAARRVVEMIECHSMSGVISSQSRASGESTPPSSSPVSSGIAKSAGKRSLESVSSVAVPSGRETDSPNAASVGRAKSFKNTNRFFSTAGPAARGGTSTPLRQKVTVSSGSFLTQPKDRLSAVSRGEPRHKTFQTEVVQGAPRHRRGLEDDGYSHSVPAAHSGRSRRRPADRVPVSGSAPGISTAEGTAGGGATDMKLMLGTRLAAAKDLCKTMQDAIGANENTPDARALLGDLRSELQRTSQQLQKEAELSIDEQRMADFTRITRIVDEVNMAVQMHDRFLEENAANGNLGGRSRRSGSGDTSRSRQLERAGTSGTGEAANASSNGLQQSSNSESQVSSRLLREIPRDLPHQSDEINLTGSRHAGVSAARYAAPQQQKQDDWFQATGIDDSSWAHISAVAPASPPQPAAATVATADSWQRWDDPSGIAESSGAVIIPVATGSGSPNFTTTVPQGLQVVPPTVVGTVPASLQRLQLDRGSKDDRIYSIDLGTISPTFKDGSDGRQGEKKRPQSAFSGGSAPHKIEQQRSDPGRTAGASVSSAGEARGGGNRRRRGSMNRIEFDVGSPPGHPRSSKRNRSRSQRNQEESPVTPEQAVSSPGGRVGEAQFQFYEVPHVFPVEQAVQSFQSKLMVTERANQDLNAMNMQQMQRIQILEQQMRTLTDEAEAKDKVLKDQQKKVEALEKDLAKRDYKIVDLGRDHSHAKDMWMRESARASALTSEVKEKDKVLLNREAQINDFKKVRSALERRIAQLEFLLDREIATHPKSKFDEIPNNSGDGFNIDTMSTNDTPTSPHVFGVKDCRISHGDGRSTPTHRQGDFDCGSPAAAASSGYPKVHLNHPGSPSGHVEAGGESSPGNIWTAGGNISLPHVNAVQPKIYWNSGMSLENVVRFRSLLSLDEGLLWVEPGVMEIGLKSQFEGTLATLRFYYGNLCMGDLEQFSVEFENHDWSLAASDQPLVSHTEGVNDSSIRWKSSPVPDCVRQGQQICQSFVMDSTGPYVTCPIARVAFRLPDGTPKVCSFRIPIPVTKFIIPVRFSPPEFFARWRSPNFVVNETTSVFTLNPQLTQPLSKLTNALQLGASLELHLGLDGDPSNIVLAGTFPPPGNPSLPLSTILVRLEIGSGAWRGKARLAVRSDNPELSTGVRTVLVVLCSAS